MSARNIAIIGAGWSGLAAAVRATQLGHNATVFEATRTLGGRARALPVALPDGRELRLDNGQHILIGAYQHTLDLMRAVGVDPRQTLLRLPLSLRYPDGTGLSLPWGRAPWDALAGIVSARGWRWRDKLSLLRAATRWRRQGFACPSHLTVAELCAGLTPRIVQEMIDPLCVSALNTPAGQASAQVFLRVLHDSLFAVAGGSNLLLPRVDLSALFPEAAARWLAGHGAQVVLGERVAALRELPQGWQVQGRAFDCVVLATGTADAARLLEHTETAAHTPGLQEWLSTAQALRHEAITTVYAYGANARLPQPMLALRSSGQHPAQFAFDRGQLDGAAGVIALVVSASQGEREEIESKVLAQARAQLGLELQALRTVTEKRATFACTAGLVRPGRDIAPGLRACGDYVEGPYPATLEGAVRSGLDAVTY